MTAVDRLGFHVRLTTAEGMRGARIAFLREVSNQGETRKVLVEMQRELIDLPSAWAKAGLSERRELCSMLFPDGLVWSHSMGFLKAQNTSIMQDLSDSLNDADDLVKFGVPDGI